MLILSETETKVTSNKYKCVYLVVKILIAGICA